MSMVEGLVFVLGSVPLPDHAAILGRPVPDVRVRTRVTAAAFYNNRGALAGSLQTFAEHNDMAHRFVASLASGGGGTWIIPAAMGLLPLAMQLADTWRKPVDAEAVQLAAEVEAMAREAMEAVGQVGGPAGEDHN
jgi:hypothetical protein